MSELVKPMLVVALRKLPLVISLIKNEQLTTPTSIEETPAKEIKAGTFDLVSALKDNYVNELKLLSAISSHCEKGIYLLVEGELRSFTLSQGALALKRIMDSLRDLGVSIELRGTLMDILVPDENEFDWLD